MKTNKTVSLDIKAVQYHKAKGHNISAICNDALIRSMVEKLQEGLSKNKPGGRE